MASRDWDAEEGSCSPLGVTWIAEQEAYNFALYSRHATGVTLLLYSEQDVTAPLLRMPFEFPRNRTGRIWHARVPRSRVPNARYYAYSVEGPFDPTQGLLFSSQKVLLDPYARALHFPPNFDRAAASRPGGNAGQAILGELPSARPPFDWSGDRSPRHTHDLIIYELHVRGYTMQANSGVTPAKRGTFAGLVEKIPYLKDLGVTAIELMPVYQWDDAPGRNYWGYMPLSFFCPHQTYASTRAPADQLDEFRAMVKAMHQADIEVILDVVYNHTTEQGFAGPTYSYRGIDNSTYYLLTPDLRGYRDDAGTGNVLRTSHPAVRKLIIDSLRYWVRETHVDGFRFDLASIFTRRDDGTIDPDEPPIISELAADPEFENIRLIAEPWDLRTYQLGRSFPGRTWMQWNGRFRDDVRAAVKSDPGQIGALMTRLYGSDDLFPEALPDVYRPFQSVNLITSHDGFCLYDLVSYQQKRNQANGEGNRDGHDDNRSWNCGFEGDDGVPAEVLALRCRQIKNFCTLLMLASGTPMILAGDEFMNTQRGNNNPYNQDNETTWLDWDRANINADVRRFWKQAIAFRKAHPTLARSRFWRGAVRWYGANGGPDLSFDSRSLAVYLDGSAEADDDIYLIVNAYWEPLPFQIQERSAIPWRRAIDTSMRTPDDIVEPDQQPTLTSTEYVVGPRGVVVLVRRRA